MKYRVGDIVKIREDLENTYAVSGMYKYKGMTARITTVAERGYGYYLIDLDHGDYCWTDNKFEEQSTATPYQSTLDVVVKELNLEYHQPFKIVSDDLKYNGMTVAFTNRGLTSFDDSNADFVLLGMLITGEVGYKIIPFSPKEGDEYWYVSIHGQVFTTKHDNGTFDYYCKFFKNQFPTKEIAEQNKEDILSKFKTIEEEYNE